MSSRATGEIAAGLFDAGKRYGATVALECLNLTLPKGQVTALLGPNGAGKSTAVSLLLGLASADSGHVELFGESPREIRPRQRMGVMLQSAALPETLRVCELLRLTASYYPRPLPLDHLVRTAGVGDLLKRSYGKLSGGQQRRVQFALAICGDPDLLCLDEPTVGLDTDSRAAVWEAVRSRVAAGCTVLLTTHYLEEAEALADKVAVLIGGRLARHGSADDIRALCVTRRIRCLTSIAADTVIRWEHVDKATRQAGHLEIETERAEEVVRRLLAEDSRLSGLEVRQGGLAEAMSQLSRGALQ